MKYFISILVIVVAIVASWWAYNHYALGLNIKGFPLKPNEGDVFVKKGKSYKFTNGEWVAFLPFSGEVERTISTVNPEVAKLKLEYEDTFKNKNPGNYNLQANRLKRLAINIKLAKYGVELTPFDDKEGLREIKVPKTLSIDNIFSREKRGGCETQYCCNGSGLWWCRAYACIDPEKGCRGCSGSCANCNCTS